MNKKIVITISLMLVMILTVGTGFAGCKLSKKDEGGPKTYVLQYTDDSGTHTIEVTEGMPYSIPSIPTKAGYDFVGLFDAETGGTQYVNASGSSLSPFSDKKNMVLFPQFKAKTFTIVLDYQGAAVTGDRSIPVSYGSSISNLPQNVTLPHSEFAGWYTKPNCQGVQIADRYGVLPSKALINERNFDLTDPDGFIRLYAGFDAETFTVTCYFKDNMPSEEIEVPYNTPVGEMVYETRVDGQAVLSWSKYRDGHEVFTGRITGDIVLYAVEYAPIIEFDSNGGDQVPPIIAKSGSSITLPTPTRENYKFDHWEIAGGETVNMTEMPSDSVQLKAVWNAMIVFDVNGGTTVKDISQKAGTSVELPTPERAGFIFAGWYTAEKDQYTTKYMPSESVLLKAGWYATKTRKITLLADNKESSIIYDNKPHFYSSYVIHFAEEITELDWSQRISVKVNFHVDIRHQRSGTYFDLYATKEHFYLYEQNVASEGNLLGYALLDHGNGEINTQYVTCEFSIDMQVLGGIAYFALAADKYGYYYKSGEQYVGWQMKNFWAEIEYPDTSNLYL